MVAMLGPPAMGFLRKSPYSLTYWDSSGKDLTQRTAIFTSLTKPIIGQWKSAMKIPDLSLEDSEEYLDGENKRMFLQFVRKMLRWDPEERQSARELLTDPWLTTP